MLQKLNLDSTKTYETALACSTVCNMLDAFLGGRTSDLSIGSEQGGISKWDDFLIEGADRNLTHVQVKRQNTDFSTHAPKRGNITKGKNKGELYPLTTIDQSLNSLANWLDSVNVNTINPKRKFKIEVADGQVKIKDGITVNDFRVLCNEHIKDITTDAGLESLVAADKNVAAIVEWLQTWCGFKDNIQILTALKLLSVYQTGNIIDIEQRSIQILSTKFNNPKDVYDALKGYINDNSTFTTAITPKIALEKVKGFLLPSVLNWTQYQKTGNSYSKTGTQDLAFGSIENASVVVANLWNGLKPSILKLDSTVDISEKLSQSIVRLALHLQAGNMAHLTNHDAWKEAAKNAIGGTLGIDKTDFDAINSTPCQGISVGADTEDLASLTLQEQEAESLNDEMQKVIWDKICDQVFKEISAHSATPLRAAIEARWLSWKSALLADIRQQRQLFTSMLHPIAEGNEIFGHLRVGLKTTGLISRGIFTLLVVSVCLDGNNDKWDEVAGALTMSTNALSYWSGPHGEKRKPQRLTEGGREKLLAAEPAKILILSDVQSSPAEMRDFSLAHDMKEGKKLADPHEPKIIVTMCPKFTDLISRGNIDAIKAYLQSQIQN